MSITDTNPDQPARPRKRRNALAGVSPEIRERFAQWVEAKVAEFPRLIAQSKALQRTRPDDAAEKRQCDYWTNALAFARFLAYWLRTERTASKETGNGPAPEESQ